eukprot:418910_1
MCKKLFHFFTIQSFPVPNIVQTMLMILISILLSIGYCKKFPEKSFESITFEIDITDDETIITVTAPSGKWHGIGFGSTIMSSTNALIYTGDTTSLEDRKLSRHAAGELLSTRTISQTTSGSTITYTMSRSNSISNCGDCFTFDPSATELKVIVALGVDFKFEDHEFYTSFTLEAITPKPTKSPTTPIPTTTAKPTSPTLSPTKKKKSGCFSSDSYVLTYPNYTRKQIEDIEQYDKILTYVELENKYIWDELLLKIHFEGSDSDNQLIPMIELTLNNTEILSLTPNHLLFIRDIGLHRADQVRIGDKLNHFNGKYVKVISIKEVMKIPRNLLTYNGNLVINGIAISSFADRMSIFSSMKYVAKYVYSYNVWRYVLYYVSKLWNEYPYSFYEPSESCSERETTNNDKPYWYSFSVFV